MIRSFRKHLAAFVLLQLAAVPAFAAEPGCTVVASTFETREFACPVGATARPLHFKADFSGGHDDTLTTMTLRLDDKPAACIDGGKLRVEREDGDVSMSCRIASAPAGATLRAVVKFSHAEYVGAGLVD